jgi:DNA-binding NtrC family response regulator
MGVGEDSDVKVNIRVLAATSRDLEKMGHQGCFRTDLFHRLKVLSIDVPALRERPDDLAPLITHFLEKYRSLCAMEPTGVSAEFLEALRQVELPGNVRQLQNIVRQALAQRESDHPLGLCDLPVELLQQLSALAPSAEPTAQVESGEVGHVEVVNYVVQLLELNEWSLSRSLKTCERHVMEAAMRHVGGNQSKAARLLGITPRSVYNKMHKHRLGSSRGSSRVL